MLCDFSVGEEGRARKQCTEEINRFLDGTILCTSVLECRDLLTARLDGQTMDCSVQRGTIRIGSTVFSVLSRGTKYLEVVLGKFAAIRCVAS